MTTCQKNTTRKYKERPSPPYHASDCKGKSMKGNDGTMYISKADAKGIYKWIRKGTQTRKVSGKRYEIHDNGGVPFYVYVKPKEKQVTVTKTVYDANFDKIIDEKELFQKKYQDIFIGDNILHDPKYLPFGQGKGNSILLQIKDNEYVYIGSEIYTFYTVKGDSIQSYHSPIGNNDFPYPVSVGKDNLYFMLSDDHVYVPKIHFDMKKDLYGQFYGHTVKDEETKKAIEKDKKKFKLKMIQKWHV